MSNVDFLLGAVLDGGYHISRRVQEEEALSLFEGEREADKAELSFRRVDLLAPSATELAQLRGDAGVLARLQNHCIPAPLDVLTGPDGAPIIVYERLVGEPLDRRLRRGVKLAGEKGAVFIRHLTRLVGIAHQAGVLHRALTPASILVDPATEDITHVIDFGIGRLGEERRRDAGTRDASFLPCPAGYLPPEQLRGGTMVVDSLCDQFALAAILYHVLTGKPPFGTGHPRAVVSRVLHAEPAPMVGVSRELERVVLRSLAKRKEERFSSLEELLTALDLAHGKKTETPAGGTQRPGSIPPQRFSLREIALAFPAGPPEPVWRGGDAGTAARPETPAPAPIRITPPPRQDLTPVPGVILATQPMQTVAGELPPLPQTARAPRNRDEDDDEHAPEEDDDDERETGQAPAVKIAPAPPPMKIAPIPTPPAQRPLPPRPAAGGRSPWLAVLIMLGAAGIAAIGIIRWTRSRATDVSPPPRRDEVQVILDVEPANSDIKVNGQPTNLRRLSLPRSQQPLRIVAEAPGHTTFSTDITPDIDQRVVVRLVPVPAAPQPAAPPTPRPRPTTPRPHASPVPPQDVDPSRKTSGSNELRDPFAN